MARWPRARWNPVSTCGPGSIQPNAVCLHHQVGNGDPAGVYVSRNVSAHFWIPKAGDPVQHVDTGIRAWHGGTDALNSNAIGVETEGCGSPPHADPLTENQLNLFAELMAWAHQTHGIPLVLSETASTPGLNYHRCQGGYATGCPCDVRLNARAEILRRAGGQPGTPTTPPPTSGGTAAPPFPGTLLQDFTVGHGTATWQSRMVQRGWSLAVDDMYGPASANVCRQFQTEAVAEGHDTGGIDGIVGPKTWALAWTKPIT